MKKIVVFIMCFMAFVLAACGSTKTNGQDKYLVLVNKTHQLPVNWEDKITLVVDKDPWGDDVVIEEETLKEFKKLQEALLEEGVDIRLDSVYRSIDDQIDLWSYFKKEYGEDYCRQYVAAPGYSEHHTGLAVDVCMVVNGKPDNDNDHMIANKELFAKVHALMPEYGFILRYPEGEEDITGYNYEPWHLRYVGSPSVAKEIAEKGLTLEEYLGATP